MIAGSTLLFFVNVHPIIGGVTITILLYLLSCAVYKNDLPTMRSRIAADFEFIREGTTFVRASGITIMVLTMIMFSTFYMFFSDITRIIHQSGLENKMVQEKCVGDNVMIVKTGAMLACHYKTPYQNSLQLKAQSEKLFEESKIDVTKDQ